MRLPDSLAPLRDRSFAWYFSGRFISTIGSVMAPVALTFAVLDLTGSPSALGEVLAARSIPLVVFLLVGGVVADRFSRSFVMQVSHLLSAVSQGMVAALLLTGVAQLWMVIVLEAINGTVSAFTFPAIQGVVPLVVPRTHIQQANALLGFTRNGLSILGPTIAGLIVVTAGSGWAIAVDALSWLVAAGCMAKLKLPAAMKAQPGKAPSMWHDLVDGWSAFTQHTWIWLIVVAFGFMNAIHAGAWFTLGPVVAKASIGIAGWGYALSAEAVGMLVMTAVLLRLRIGRPLLAGMIGVSALAGPILLLGLSPSLVPLLVLTFVSGCGSELFGIGWSTALQEHIPDQVLSRVSSYDALGSFVAIPVGELTFGPLATAFNARDVMVVGAVIYVVIALITLSSRSVRDLRRADIDPAEAAAPGAP